MQGCAAEKAINALGIHLVHRAADAAQAAHRCQLGQAFDNGSAVVSLIGDRAIEVRTTCTMGKRDR